MVFDGLRIGGIEKVGLEYISLFQKLGNTITVVNLRPNLNDFAKLLDNNVNIVDISFPRWLAPERYASILRKVSWGKFVYPFAYLFVSFLLFFYKKYIYLMNPKLRESYDVGIAFSGHVNDLTFVSDRFANISKSIAWCHGAMYGYCLISSAYYFFYRKIKNIVSLSDFCDAEFFEFINKYKINKKTIYNPIKQEHDSIDYSIVNSLKREYGNFCLMVARMDNDKDQKTVIDAMCILKKKYNMTKNLVLVGDGTNKIDLERYVKQINMQNQIYFMGSRFDVYNFYKAAYIYVHSSPLEGLPTVIIEALSFNLPIASTDSIPGVREVLGNNEYGLISDIGNPDSLADNIYELYKNDHMRNTLKERTFNRSKDFLPDKIAIEIQDFFKNLI